MKLIHYSRLAGLALGLSLLPQFAAAQNSVKCESNNGHRKYCGSYSNNPIRLDRQISGSPCTEGQTWGVDRKGLWVDRGCRAYFTIMGSGGRGRYNDRGGWNNGGSNFTSVKCESNNGRRNYCGNYRRVRLDRQISGSPCIEGKTWGVDRNGLWVDRGCRATFMVAGNSQGGGNWNNGGSSGSGNNGGWWNPQQGDTWPPRGNWHGGNWGSGGACFYKDRNFRGSFFCLRRGEQRESLGGYGDQISSVRAFGGARVELYDDRDFRGAREGLSGDASDLHQLGVSQKPGHTWNDRVSSVRVQ